MNELKHGSEPARTPDDPPQESEPADQPLTTATPAETAADDSDPVEIAVDDILDRYPEARATRIHYRILYDLMRDRWDIIGDADGAVRVFEK